MPVCVPQPTRNFDSHSDLRRPRVLASAEAALQGTFCVVADGKEPTRRRQAHQVQVLLAAGNPEVAAAPVWRGVGT